MANKKTILNDYLKECFSIEEQRYNLYSPADHDRMFVYAWYEILDIRVNNNKVVEGETKFGQRWVFAGQDPLVECEKRIRESVSTRKDKFDDNSIKKIRIWDVTEYAKKYDRYHIKAKVDDHIRKKIGHCKQGEVHNLDPIMLYRKVNEILKKENQSLPIIGLKGGQIRAILSLMNHYYNKATVVLGDLYARFGKTIFSLALSIEMNWDLTIIASYVKTSFRSYENDISGGEQFKNMVVIHASDPLYIEKINDALNKNKKPVVFLSLCKGEKRDDRIKKLLSYNVSTGLIVDEADFGAWRIGQSEPLRDNALKNDNCKIFLMSGSNIERAGVCWPVDAMILETYYEALLDKNEVLLGVQNLYKQDTLKYFKHNPELDAYTVIPRFFQVNISRIVEDSIKYYKYINDNASVIDIQNFLDNLPSFSKFYKNPIKGKGWFIRFIQAVFQGQHNRPELNAEHLIYLANEYKNINNENKPQRRVAQLFVSENITNKNLDVVGELIKEALPTWEIIILHGGKKGISQYTAEKIAKERLEKLILKGYDKKPVLILCSKMGQRSFTLAETTELYLAYDGGSQAGNDQKISRVLSPNYLSAENKIGNIFSLSFDPNRDDKIEDSIWEAALNVSKKHKIEPRKAAKKIRQSIDIFSSDENGNLHFINNDEFIIESMKKGSIYRAVGVIFEIEGMSHEDKLELISGDNNYQSDKNQNITQHGKTNEDDVDKNDDENNDDKEPISKEEQEDINKLVKHVISALCKNFGEIFIATNTTNCKDAIEKMIYEDDNNINKWRKGIFKNHGISLDIINKLILIDKRLKAEWIELSNHLTIKEISS